VYSILIFCQQESSFTSSLSTGSGRLNRFSSSLSSRGDSSSSATGNYGSNNLSAGSKSSYGSSLSKEKTPTSSGYGSSSIGSLASKFSSNNNDSSYRSTSSSASAYSRTPEPTSSTSAKETMSSKSKGTTSTSLEPTKSSYLSNLKAKDTSGASTASTGSSSETTSSSTSNGLTGYRPYSSRTLAGTSDVLNSSTVSSALRTTARFGIRSGTSHALYSSSLPTASTLKAAAKLAEETKKEINKKESSKLALALEKDSSPVSWMSRGTCTFLDSLSANSTSEEDDEDETEISSSQLPPFEPRVFSSRYDGVLKHKGIQTDEEQKPKLLPSAIPRPSVSMNYYNTYGTAMNRFNAAKSAPVAQKATEVSSSTSPKSFGMPDSAVDFSLSSQDEESNSSSMNTESSSFINNNGHNKTPGTMTSGSDQSSRSSHQTNVAESSSNCNNGLETVTSGSTTTTTTTTNSSPRGSISGMNKGSTATTSTGFVISVANKEFRKSALNVGLDSKDAEVEFARKQEELRLKKATSAVGAADHSSSSSPVSSSSTVPVINNNSNDNQNNSSISSSPSLLANTKRDPPSRPPTDSTKSLGSNILLHSKSINKLVFSQESNASAKDANDPKNSAKSASPSSDRDSPVSGGGIVKMKSTKSIIQLRKFSTASSNSSDSESTSSSSNANSASIVSCKVPPTTASANSNVIASKVKKKLLSHGSNNSLDKVQVRRGSVTSGSSAVSSRSNSVERSVQNNNNNCHNQNDHNQLIHNSNGIKREKGSGISNLPTVNKPPSGSLSSSGKDRTKKDATSSTTASTMTTTTKPKVLPKYSISPTASEAQKDTEVSPPSQNLSPSRNTTPSREEPKPDEMAQTSYLLRTLGSEKPWVRKCQSGELPWWLTSNPDVPSLLGKTPSKTILRNPTSKDLHIAEEAIQMNYNHDDNSSTSELSDCSDLDDGDDPRLNRPLGERTSPDGIEVTPTLENVKSKTSSVTSILPAAKGKEKSTKRKGSLDSSQDRAKPKTSERKSSLFISNLTNIDDILGTVSPALPANSPSPAPITFSEAELCEAQRKMSLNDNEDSSDDDSSDESSSSSEIFQDELDQNEMAKRLRKGDSDASESAESSDDDGSTGTSSSFEEVDPCSVKITQSTLSPGYVQFSSSFLLLYAYFLSS
jgi:hypothetical protein